MTTTVDAVVVGGGPTGLAVADALAGRGRSVALIEAAEHLGGMARSIDVDGVRVDLGSHRLHPVAEPAVEALLHDLVGDDLVVRPRHGRIRLAGRWLRFPLRVTDLVRRLPPGFAVRAVTDALAAPIRARRHPDPESFADVVRAGLGPAMLEEFYGPFAHKLWGVPAEDLAGDLARRRIAASTPSRLATKLLPRRGSGPTFRYPRHGYGQVVEALADRAVARGARVRTGVRVTALRPDPTTDPTTDAATAPATDRAGASAGGRTTNSAGAPSTDSSSGPATDPEAAAAVDVVLDDDTTLRARRVFWTAAPATLARVAGGAAPAPPDVRALSPPRAMACVFCSFPVARVTPFDAHYLPGAEVASSRISEPSNYRDEAARPVDRTVLCAEVPCDIGDDVWQAGDAALGDLVLRDLATLGIDVPAPRTVVVERLASVYPVIRTGDVATVAALRDWSQRVPGVTTLGRQGFVVADNLHHVLAMALDAAACLSDDGAWDEDAWRRSVRRFEDFVVED